MNAFCCKLDFKRKHPEKLQRALRAVTFLRKMEGKLRFNLYNRAVYILIISCAGLLF